MRVVMCIADLLVTASAAATSTAMSARSSMLELRPASRPCASASVADSTTAAAV